MDPQFRGTLQEALDQYTTRLRIVTPYGLLRVVVSDVAPTSNVGLWLKNGTKPYVWDEVSSVYVPLDISDSLSFDYDTIVAIVLANFSLADAYLLDGRINRTGMIADGIITSAKLKEPFGPGHSIIATDATGTTYWVGLAPDQFVQANPTTGAIEAGNKDYSSAFAALYAQYNYTTLPADYKNLPSPGSLVQFAHGLKVAGVAVTPSKYSIDIVCVASGGDPTTGYVLGDVVPWTCVVYPSLTESSIVNTTFANSTLVGGIYYNEVDGLALVHKTIGNLAPLDSSLWRVRATASV